MNKVNHSPWSSYTAAVLGILAIVKQTVPMSRVDKRRIDEAAELVQAAADIITLEEAVDPDEVEDLDELDEEDDFDDDDDDDDDDEFIRLH